VVGISVVVGREEEVIDGLLDEVGEIDSVLGASDKLVEGTTEMAVGDKDAVVGAVETLGVFVSVGVFDVGTRVELTDGVALNVDGAPVTVVGGIVVVGAALLGNEGAPVTTVGD